MGRFVGLALGIAFNLVVGFAVALIFPFMAVGLIDGLAAVTTSITGALTLKDCGLMGVNCTSDETFWAMAVLIITVVRLPGVMADANDDLDSIYKASADEEQLLPPHGYVTSVVKEIIVSVGRPTRRRFSLSANDPIMAFSSVFLLVLLMASSWDEPLVLLLASWSN